MLFDYQNKIVLITGASSGIGRASAFEYGKNGAKIALTGRNKDELASLNKDLKKLNINSQFFVFDLLKLEGINRLIEEIEEYFEDTIDVLINSAGKATLGLVDNIPLNELIENMELNFFAPFELSRLLIPKMKKKQQGQIINITSGVGKRGLPGASSYSASKFALNGFSDSLRVELMNHNIDLILFSPGLVESNFADRIKVFGKLKNTFTEGNAMDPKIVASKLLAASKKRKRDVTLSLKTRLGIHLNYIAPRFMDKYLSTKL
mgnify:CR=1 FL=1